MAKVNVYVGVRDEALIRQLRAMLKRKRVSLGVWLVGVAAMEIAADKAERAAARGTK